MSDQTGPQQAKATRTRTSILQAAGDVVRLEGVSSLTLERVATVAGVSKGGLLYHFGTKQELVIALLANTLGRADAELQSLAAANDRAKGAVAQAYLDYIRSGRHDEVDSASGIFAAAALDDGDLEPARAMFHQWQERLVEDDGIDTTTALLARVVGDGLWLIDLFGLAPPTTEQRNALFELVEAAIDRSA